MLDFDDDKPKAPKPKPPKPMAKWEDTASPIERRHAEMRRMAQHSSDSVEHYTPADVVSCARELMGGIDLDPASSDLANQIVQAKEWYGYKLQPEFKERTPYRAEYEFIDGLMQPWYGKVFLNPPGGMTKDKAPHLTGLSKSYATIWWGKLISDYESGDIDQAVFVGFSLELLLSIQRLNGVRFPLTFPHCIPQKRILFDYPNETQNGLATHYAERQQGSQPTHGNFIVWLPPKTNGVADIKRTVTKFHEVFGGFGYCR